jgi:hypothetical protein
MRDAGAWCAAGIVVAGGLAPLLVGGSALPMMLGMLGLVLFLLAHGGLTYGWRGALGFFACAYLVAFAFEALAKQAVVFCIAGCCHAAGGEA